MAEIGVLSAKVALDTVDFGRNIQSVKRELKVAKSEFVLAGQGVTGFGQASHTSSAQMDALTKQINIQKQAVGEYQRRYDEATKSHQEGDRALQNAKINYNNAAHELSKLERQYDALSKTVAYLNDPLHLASEKISEFGFKANAVGDTLINVGKKWSVLGMTVTGVAGLTAKAAIDYETAFTGIVKTTDATASELDVLNQGLRDLAMTIPTTATELAGIGELAGQLGIHVPNMLSFTETIAALGEATNMSMEQGATQFAKFMNITGTAQEEVGRLGSTLVALGNNFATTESDIMNMSMRLAGAGSQIGMSEAEILSLSTALSSLGIEAEAGGSAFSKVMINMAVATEAGGEDLQAFAKVAGMSASEFKVAFQEDAMGAIAAFVEGLGTASEHGETAIGILNEMGISEVRLRDSLLRSAGAHELLSGAIEIGNTAWEENTALTREAEIRYGTTASQLQIAKNKITDLAIGFGNELLPSIANALEATEPFVEGLANMVQGFADADESTKKLIIGLGAFVIAGGPVLASVGGLAKGVGSLSTAIADGVDWLAKYRTGFNTVEEAGGTVASVLSGKFIPSVASTGTEVAGATNSIEGFAVSVGGIALKAAPWALAIGAIGLAGYEIYKNYQDAKESVELWGAEVPKQTASVLQNVQGASLEVVGHMGMMSSGFETNTDSMIENIQLVGTTLETDLTNRIDGITSAFEGLSAAIQVELQGIYDAEMERLGTSRQNISDHNDQIAQIRQNALDNNRQITYEEGIILKNLMQKNAEEYLNITIDNAEDRQKILEAMTGDVEAATDEQARIWAQTLGKQRQTANMEYNQQLEEQKQFLKALGYSLESDFAKDWLGTFEQNHQDTLELIDRQTKTLVDKYPELAEEISLQTGIMLDRTSDEYSAWVEQNKKYLNELDSLMTETVDRTSFVLQSTEELATSWNRLILDEKTGEVKTNLSEVLIESAQTEEGWEILKFASKQANIDSNAKVMIAEALLATGQWDDLSLVEKQALLKDSFSGTVLLALEQKGIWEHLSFEDKHAILNSNTQEEVALAIAQIGIWDAAEPTLKSLELDNLEFYKKLSESTEDLEAWNNLTPFQKDLLINNNDALLIMAETGAGYKEYDAIPDSLKKLVIQNYDAVNPITDTQEKLDKYNRTRTEKKTLTVENRTANDKINDSQRRKDLWNRTQFDPKEVKVTADTSGATEAKDAIDSVPSRKTSIIEIISKAITKHATGTDFHHGGLAILGDGGKNEPFLTPGGMFGVSPASDTLYDLPTGTKVWSSVEKFMNELPHFATGTTRDLVNETLNQSSRALGNLYPMLNRQQRTAQQIATEDTAQAANRISTTAGDTTELTSLFREFVGLMRSGAIGVNMDGEILGQIQESINDRNQGKKQKWTDMGVLT